MMTTRRGLATHGNQRIQNMINTDSEQIDSTLNLSDLVTQLQNQQLKQGQNNSRIPNNHTERKTQQTRSTNNPNVISQ